MTVYIVDFLQTLKKCLTMESPKQSITATIKGSVTDIIHVGGLHSTNVSLCYLLCVTRPAAYRSIFDPRRKHLCAQEWVCERIWLFHYENTCMCSTKIYSASECVPRSHFLHICTETKTRQYDRGSVKNKDVTHLEESLKLRTKMEDKQTSWCPQKVQFILNYKPQAHRNFYISSLHNNLFHFRNILGTRVHFAKWQ